MSGRHRDTDTWTMSCDCADRHQSDEPNKPRTQELPAVTGSGKRRLFPRRFGGEMAMMTL